MASWQEISEEIRNAQDNYETIRHKYLQEFRELRKGRNVIAYYSGFLHNSSLNCGIDDRDLIAFMSLSIGKREEGEVKGPRAGVEHSKGLDLILHTPGGDVTVVERIMNFLYGIYGLEIKNSIEVFVPQLAMSAGTMMACGASIIHMGQYSSLGPIDPHYENTPTWAILDEFDRFQEDVTENPMKYLAWKPIVSKYEPGYIEQLRQVNEASKEIVKGLLTRDKGMFHDLKKEGRQTMAEQIADKLSDYKRFKLHGRQISIKQCEEIGLRVHDLAVAPQEDEGREPSRDEVDFQDKVKSALLSYHHACDHTLRNKPIGKFIENHLGRVYYLGIGRNRIGCSASIDKEEYDIEEISQPNEFIQTQAEEH